MYCCHCGTKAAGEFSKFCSGCGARLSLPPAAAPAPLPTPAIADWSDVTQYETLMSIPAVRERIAKHAAQAKKSMTGEEFLELCDKAFKPIAGIPLSSVAAIVQPLYRKLGIATGKTRSHSCTQRPGTVLVAVLCSLAKRGQELQNVTQTEDGCVLEATIPSDLFSFAGDLVITVHRVEGGTMIEAATRIHGQLYDWGKSTKCLSNLLQDISRAQAAA